MNLNPDTADDAERLQVWEQYRHGMYHLSMGNFAEGWRLFDERTRLYPAGLQACLTGTPDTVEYFAGKRVTIIGDPDWKPVINGKPQPDYRIMMGGFELLFAQYLPKVLAQEPDHVRLLCDPRLTTLLARSFPDVEVIARDPDADRIGFQVAPDSDIVVSLASLGMSCVHSATDIPYSLKPWLRADPARTQDLRELVEQKTQGRVPLAYGCWSAGIQGKSIEPEEFLKPFSHMTDRFCFVNLQGFPPGDSVRPARLSQAFSNVFGNDSWMDCQVDLWNDIDGTASLLQAVKDLNGLAVMIPNYTEMVVCGIGLTEFKPLHADTHFRYGAGRVWNEDWFIYPETQTFLQDTPGDWTQPLDRIAMALETFQPGQPIVQPIRHDRMAFKPPTVEHLTGDTNGTVGLSSLELPGRTSRPNLAP